MRFCLRHHPSRRKRFIHHCGSCHRSGCLCSLVPSGPDFFSRTRWGFPPSRVAHLPGAGSTVSRRPRRGLFFHPFPREQGSAGFNALRISPFVPCPRRPISHKGGIGSKEALQPPAPVATQRAQLRALRYSTCSAAVGRRSLAGLVVRP